MIPIGMLLAWGGYAAGFWGYCLIRGYNLSFTDLVSPVHYYTGPKAARPGGWPPKCCPPDVIIPSKATIGKGVACGGTAAPGTGTAVTATAPAPAPRRSGVESRY